LPPLRMARLDFAAGSLLGSPFGDPAFRPVEPRGLGVSRRPVRFGGPPGFPRGLFVHEAPNDRASDIPVASPHTPSTVIRLSSSRTGRARGCRDRFDPACREANEACHDPRCLLPARPLLGASSDHTQGACSLRAPTHDVLSPATRARCLATPRATRELRLPATRTAPSGLGRSTARASWNPTFACRLLQHARPASTPRGSPILARTG